MFKPEYTMLCGCKLQSADLIVYKTLLSCPVHKKSIAFIEKRCQRCACIITLDPRNNRRLYCTECVRLLDLARTLCVRHELDSFTDPFLWHKPLKDILESININLFLGYEAIQIDEPKPLQYEGRKIVIDIDTKLKTLHKRKQL